VKLGYPSVRLIIIIAALVIPFTSLRFGPVGLGEILVVVASALLLVLNGGRIQVNNSVFPLVRFWYVYLFVISVGFAYNIVVLDHASGTFPGAAFDFASYVVILGAIIVLGDRNLFIGTSPERFFTTIFVCWTIAYSALYLLSFVTPQIFGLPLRYYNHFSPLVDNVHQAAMVTAAMPFVMWHLGVLRGPIMFRLFCFGTGALFVKMALESGSTKALVAVIVGGAVSALFIVFGLLTRRGGWMLKASALVAVAAASVLLVVANADSIVPFATQFFQDNDGAHAREGLYSIGFQHAMDSIIVGYGPGPHILYDFFGEYSDAHNTILTIVLQGGLVAIIAALMAVYSIAKRTASSAFLIATLSSIAIYMIGGDILRRLPIWIIIVGVLYLSRSANGSAKAVGVDRAANGSPETGFLRQRLS